MQAQSKLSYCSSIYYSNGGEMSEYIVAYVRAEIVL